MHGMLTVYIYALFSLKFDLKLKVVTGQVADSDARDIIVVKLVNSEEGLFQ